MGAPPNYQVLISTGEVVTATKLDQRRAYTFGRAPECDVVVNDRSVSRKHATIHIDEELWLEDEGSRNGTRVDGRSVPARERTTLPIGSVIQLGSASVVFQRVREPSEHAADGNEETAPGAGPGALPIAGRIVADPTMRNIYAMVDLVAPTMLGVLILGETGVGKEVFANELHRRSRRAKGPFVQLNCAALPESILEAELFGYEKGAFTGATTAKAGLFESAHGGTVFLDEVGDMPLATQVKMLRFLESGEVLRLGSVKTRQVDVRVVSATNRDLNHAMSTGAFRTDLYFRLNGMTFTIPPLRRRKADIAPLAAMFATMAAIRLGRRAPRLTPEAIEMLEGRPWMGNVRELKNVIERAIVLSGVTNAAELTPEHFDDSAFNGPEAPSAFTPRDDEITGRFPVIPALAGDASTDATSLESEIRDLERKRIVAALDACNGNQSKAARRLGISRAVLLNRMKVFGLARSKKS